MNAKKKKQQKQQLSQRIHQLREAIRRKYRAFKLGTVESEVLLEKQYKPLISSLSAATAAAAATSVGKVKKEEVKEEEEEEEEETLPRGYDPSDVKFVPSAFSSPNRGPDRRLKRGDEETFGDLLSDEEEEAVASRDVSSVLATAEGMHEASRFIEENFRHPLTRRYMLKVIKDLGGKKRTIDHLYGPKYEMDTLTVGNKPLTFDDDGAIRIDDVRYRPTEGLYELLFKRLPDDTLYDDADLNAYRNILLKTDAHKKNYDPKGSVNRNTSLKYKHVIKRIFPPSREYSGRGAVTIGGRGGGTMKSASVPDIVYWDDADELVDRLRLVIASAETGNTGHANEIAGILEELREAGIIRGAGNSGLRSLLR